MFNATNLMIYYCFHWTIFKKVREIVPPLSAFMADSTESTHTSIRRPSDIWKKQASAVYTAKVAQKRHLKWHMYHKKGAFTQTEKSWHIRIYTGTAMEKVTEVMFEGRNNKYGNKIVNEILNKNMAIYLYALLWQQQWFKPELMLQRSQLTGNVH